MRRGRSPANIALLVYCVLCAGAVAWPLYPLLADRIRPFVFGLPFGFAWNVGWVVLTFLVVALFHLCHGEQDDS